MAKIVLFLYSPRADTLHIVKLHYPANEFRECSLWNVHPAIPDMNEKGTCEVVIPVLALWNPVQKNIGSAKPDVRLGVSVVRFCPYVLNANYLGVYPRLADVPNHGFFRRGVYALVFRQGQLGSSIDPNTD